MQTEVTRLLGIEYPIIQGGMAWVAEYHLAAGVSEAGGLGLIGAASAPADWVRDQVRKAKELTDKPFGVNIMLMSPYADEVAKVIVEEGVKVVTTGAGNPEKYMKMWKEAGVKVIPVVASVALAKRMERCGADALVAEGCEAGGHIGESTTMVLVPQIADAVKDPSNDAESLSIVLTDGTSIEFDEKALSKKTAQTNQTDITISIKRTTDSALSALQQQAVGSQPAWDIKLTSGGKNISDMGGVITLHTPYELRSGEQSNGIVVYYVDENGNRESCETSYDPVKKLISWKTSHLSVYMIGYDENRVTPDTDTEDQSALNGSQVSKLKLPILLATGKGGNRKITISWRSYEDADGYDCYWSYCDGKRSYKKLATVKAAKDRVTSRRLDNNRRYKYFVAAYKLIDGKKVYIAKSNSLHVALKDAKATNAKKVTVNQTNVRLKAGDTFVVKSRTRLENTNKKELLHVAAYRYYTSDQSVASVSKTGKIKALKSGTCVIYVVANNGVYGTVEVTVN